jgi:MoaA/NifB/PqqE/SkfB family radical SAM enzyme
MMSRDEVAARLAEGLALGVKEVYFTGGEPFLNREMDEVLDDTLALAPATVLTNGTLFTQRRVAFLRDLAARARFSLELRVSFDGADAAAHDAFRGPGSFLRAMDGLRAVSAAGLMPIATVTQSSDEDALEFRERWFALLRAEGIEHPRLKVLPMFQLGREEHRTRGYRETESLALLPQAAFDPHRLQCGSCRAVTSQGVFPCPLLIDAPRARMGATLGESSGAFTLDHGACHTCWVTGMTCGNG